MFIEPSLAGGFLWQGADMRSSYKTADPYHLLSTPAALTTHQMPPIQVWWTDGLSQFKEDTGEPSVPAWEFNLMTCWQGWKMNPRPAELVSQAHCTAAPTALALWATEAGCIQKLCKYEIKCCTHTQSALNANGKNKTDKQLIISNRQLHDCQC